MCISAILSFHHFQYNINVRQKSEKNLISWVSSALSIKIINKTFKVYIELCTVSISFAVSFVLKFL